ncbi:MAG: SET domain-containing protein-lysine N-methyltransferase [Deltaproteobacteria bacterium]|nr:SET domain-containing protein-lysine N-methyltransferase [Deltaproteobacteria bacterium]
MTLAPSSGVNDLGRLRWGAVSTVLAASIACLVLVAPAFAFPPGTAMLHPAAVDLVLERRGSSVRVRRGKLVRVAQYELPLHGSPSKVTVYYSAVNDQVLGVKTVGAERVAFYSGSTRRRSELEKILKAKTSRAVSSGPDADLDLFLGGGERLAGGRLTLDRRDRSVLYTYAGRPWRNVKDRTSLAEALEWLNRDGRNLLNTPLARLQEDQRPRRTRRQRPAAPSPGAVDLASRRIQVDRGAGIEELSPLAFKKLFGVTYLSGTVLAPGVHQGRLWEFADPRHRRSAGGASDLSWPRASSLEQVAFGKKTPAQAQRIVARRIRRNEAWKPWEARAAYHELLRAGHVAPVYIKEVPELTQGGRRGWGLFAARDLAVGDLIGAYAGELDWGQNRQDRAYVLGGTHEREVIDARHKGNETRFVNHSSAHPNAKMGAIPVDGLVQPFLFVSRPVKAGEQLLFDYGQGYWDALDIVPGELGAKRTAR